MAAITVLISGWIGLAYAVALHILSDSTIGQFMLTWMQVGLIAVAVFAVIAGLRRMASHVTAQHA